MSLGSESPHFGGSIVALVTPMLASGQIDYDAFERLLDLQAASGTAGVVIGGSTGESPTVTEGELRELLQRALLHRSRTEASLRLIVGAGTNSTAASVERARAISQAGPDALLVVAPAYNKPTQEGLYRHFAAVAEASSVPVILYNVPTRTAVDLLPATVARLAQLPRVAGIKEAVASIERIRELVQIAQQLRRQGATSRFDVLSGDDPTAREAVLAGATGVISVLANVAPAEMSALIAAALRGEREHAARIDAQLAPLNEALFLESNPIPLKYALERLGLAGGTLRLPLTPLSPQFRSQVDAALAAAGLLQTRSAALAGGGARG